MYLILKDLDFAQLPTTKSKLATVQYSTVVYAVEVSKIIRTKWLEF